MNPSSIPPLSGEWAKMFSASSEELTEYAKKHPLHLKDVTIKKQNVSKSQFTGARFENTIWDDSFAQSAAFTDTTFLGGRIYDTSFADATLTNVTFENVTLEKVEFVGAKLINVTFRNCKIYDSDIRNLVASKIRLEDTEVTETRFFQSELNIEIVGTKVHESGDFRSLKTGSSVYVENSFIGPYSQFDNSTLTTFTVKSSTIENSKLNQATVDSVSVENRKLNFAVAESNIDKFEANNVDDIVLGESTVNHISISNCQIPANAWLYEVSFNTFQMNDCSVTKLDFGDAKGGITTLEDTQIEEAKFGQFVGNKITMNNVQIMENADFENAQVEQTQFTNVTIAPDAKVNLTGSNIKLP